MRAREVRGVARLEVEHEAGELSPVATGNLVHLADERGYKGVADVGGEEPHGHGAAERVAGVGLVDEPGVPARAPQRARA